MEKLKLQTHNIVDENIKKIAELFPNCLTERLDENGKPEAAIDFDQLRQELSKDIVEGPEERYQFTWPDKRNAIRLANAPTTDTLRPCREESVDFDNTQNLYIEGDNLEVLKLLRENYLGKVKMIYIDPPYNTGNDFVYNDDFAQTTGDYVHNSGQEDEEGNRLVANTESNGRFHTDWLNMIYPRLKVAKDLLSEDGVIFISIGGEELENLTKICKEVFGSDNYLTTISRLMKSGGNNGDFFSPNIDYVLVFTRDRHATRQFKCDMSDELISNVYNKVETEGPRKGERYRTMGLYQASLTLERSANARYYIDCPDGTKCIPPVGKRWRVVEPSYKKMLSDDEILFVKTQQSPLLDEHGKQSTWNVYTKIWLRDRQEEGQTPTNFINKYENRHSAKELNSIGIPFDFSKPVGLVKYLLYILRQDNNICILDFFSGSATTAHAVMQLNAEDCGNRKFIMVQLPEATDEKSEAYKAGYKNICEIGKERIRRAGKKIVEELEKKKVEEGLFAGSSAGSEARLLDIGFRVLKLDSSNMQDVYYSPEQFNENLLFEDNIKHDRTDEDLLFQAMIELGIELSAKIEQREIAGKTVWSVAEGYLMACFDKDVNETTITEIARQHPYYFVLRDSSLATDNVADNFEQIWEEYSKETVRRII
ncbi:MAG: site-specific DNA-methyltransferase [Bacteroidales bacterium]|nr:site-specific DNA-methyltransferase [Bacteroidales bacterium]